MLKIKRIQTPNLQQEIIYQIKSYIYRHKLKPGDMLPSQADMTKQLGISRPSVREAISAMEAQNLLRAVNGKGIYVEMIDASFRDGEIDEEYMLMTFRDALQVRKALEGAAVELCTMVASQKELDEIDTILLQVEDKIRKNEEQSDLDYLFHRKISLATGNPLLTNLLSNIMQQSSGYWSIEQEELKTTLTESIAGHREMLNHMLARNKEKAVQANNRYIDTIIKDVGTLITRLKSKNANIE